MTLNIEDLHKHNPELIIARNFGNRAIRTQMRIIDEKLLEIMQEYKISKQEAPKRIAIQHHPHGIYLAVDGNIVTDNLRLKVVVK